MSFIWLPPAIASALTYIPAIGPLVMIGMTMILFGEFLIFLITEIPKLFKLALSIFTPEVFLRDLIFGLFTAIMMVIKTIGDLITGIIETIFNTIFGQSTGGFFGQGPQKNPKTGKMYNPKNKTCKRPPSIFRYIILILCPPFYIFLNKGLSGWIYILIDLLLTAFFYFPGLIYALITCPICF
jgi:uncharacterized membrane protein YqaE (UPF0057 family)